DEKKILVEDQSTNTVENLTFSKKLLPNVDSVAVVTSNFHVYRSVRIARKAGYKKVEGVAARSSHLYLLTNMVREFFAIIKDKLSGNI
ncbi:MAG: YdcF family protein, partial [Faecalicoccus sp.]|nr:YdcF family protein [Faecalicoccus sp.]